MAISSTCFAVLTAHLLHRVNAATVTRRDLPIADGSAQQYGDAENSHREEVVARGSEAALASHSQSETAAQAHPARRCIAIESVWSATHSARRERLTAD